MQQFGNDSKDLTGRERPVPRAGVGRIRLHMVTESSAWPPTSIFLNSNESAYGPSIHAINAARAATGNVHRYVENQHSILVPALSRLHGLDPASIAIGSGSDDLLARLARCYLLPGTELLRSANSYLKVPNYAFANDALPVAAPDVDFRVDIASMLDHVTPETRMVYLANPDNPSGTMVSIDEIRQLHGRLRSDILLVIDCAYAEYVDRSQAERLAEMVEANDNVVVTRTFSKVYGLSGARVGWMHAPSHVIKSVARLALTFPLTTPSLMAALAALDDQAHVRKVIGINREMRERYAETFGRLCEHVYVGQTNFLLLRFGCGSKPASGAAAYLRARGISVRRFAAPAYDSCVRVTLGKDDELHSAAEALERYMND